jgi:hypothetical protein
MIDTLTGSLFWGAVKQSNGNWSAFPAINTDTGTPNEPNLQYMRAAS